MRREEQSTTLEMNVDELHTGEHGIFLYWLKYDIVPISDQDNTELAQPALILLFCFW